MLLKRCHVLFRSSYRSQILLKCLSTESGIVKSKLPDVFLPNVPLHSFVWQNVNKWVNATAIECGVSGRKFSYGQLFDNCKRLASSLKKLGLKPGDTVAIMLPNTPEFAVAYLGSLECGLIVSTINPAYTKHEVLHQLNDCGAKWIICHPWNLSAVLDAARDMEGLHIVCTNDINGTRPSREGVVSFEDMMATTVERIEFLDDESPDVALIAYSSGTTGLPKGTCLTHKSISANMKQFLACVNYAERQEIDGQVVLPGILPFFHCYGNIVVLLLGLHFGGKIITLPKFDGGGLLKILENNKNIVLKIVPPIVFFLANNDSVTEKHFRGIKSIISGAAPLSDSDINKVHDKLGNNITLIQAYGMTEASPVLTINHTDLCNKATSGSLLPNTLSKVISVDNGETLLENQPGELCFKGPQLMKEYLNNPKATAATIDSDGWLRTGDIGYYDKDGQFYITDRLKELIKVKGFQVPPAELEYVLRKHPDILEAGIVGAPCNINGEKPVAFVQTVPGSTLTEKDVKDYVASQLAWYKHLSAVQFLPTIPKTASGKILRKQLRTMI